MKELRFFGLFIFAILVLFDCVQGQIFSQDFSSSTVVGDYVNATPNNGQFNAISSSGVGTVVSINGGALQSCTANAGSFSRTSHFNPTPGSLAYKLDITVSGNTVAQTTAAVFQIGSAFGRRIRANQMLTRTRGLVLTCLQLLVAFR